MLIYFLIWFALGLYGAVYMTVVDYRKGAEVEISIGNILLVVSMSAIFGAVIAAWAMGHTFSRVFSFLGKPIYILKRNKK